MRHPLKFALAAILASTSVLAHADFPADFIKHFPAATGAKIEPAFPGFWSVQKGADVFFVRDDMSVLIIGNVIDLKTNHSITADLKAANQPKIDVSQLDLNDAIKFGNGSRRLYVFSDPDCPYCRKLEGELTQLSDVEIYLFPYPLAQLHPNAPGVAQSIWCLPDRAAAWRDYQTLAGTIPAQELTAAWQNYLSQHGQPKQATCSTPIARNLALGDKWQIQGTPALIFEDGTMIPGLVPAARIEAQLAASHQKIEDSKPK